MKDEEQLGECDNEVLLFDAEVDVFEEELEVFQSESATRELEAQHDFVESRESLVILIFEIFNVISTTIIPVADVAEIS